MQSIVQFMLADSSAWWWGGALAVAVLGIARYLISRFGNWTLSVLGMLRGQTIEWHPNGNPKKWICRPQDLKESATQAKARQTKSTQPNAKKTK